MSKCLISLLTALFILTPVPTPAATTGATFAVTLFADIQPVLVADLHPFDGTQGIAYVTDDADCNVATADDGIILCIDTGLAWELVGSGGGGLGDITAVGDCATGACFQTTTATHVLASPVGGGVALFRALTDADIPNTITVDLATAATSATTADSATTATTATTANAGDSATSFFPAGTIEHERGGLEADVSAYAGLVRIAAGATSNVTNLAGLNTALGSSIADGAHTVDTTRTDEEIQDVAGAMVTGNTESGIAVTYQDIDGTLDFILDTLGGDATGPLTAIVVGDDSHAHTDSTVADALTFSSGTISSSDITLKAGTVPTVEGRVEWNTTTDRILVGDGVGTQTFHAGPHTVDTDTDTTCLDAGVVCSFAGSASEGGPATTALALNANGGNCAAGQYPLGVDASGAVESCTADNAGTDDQTGTEVPYTPTTATDWVDPDPVHVAEGLDDLASRLTIEEAKADDDIPEVGDFTNLALSGDISSSGLVTTIGADKILESHLKAVDAAGDEECLTFEVTTGDFEWQTCGAGGSSAFADLTSGTNATAAMVVGTGASLTTSGSGTITATSAATSTTSSDLTCTDCIGGTEVDESLLTIDHGATTELLDDDHTQYPLLLGRAGGQTLIGGTASGDDLTLRSTSNATRGTLFLGDAASIDGATGGGSFGNFFELSGTASGTKPLLMTHPGFWKFTTGLIFETSAPGQTIMVNTDSTTRLTIGDTLTTSSTPIHATTLRATGNDSYLNFSGNNYLRGGNFIEGGMVINDAGGNFDTRIEGDTETNLFITDASSDRVGIGIAAPDNRLHVRESNAAEAVVAQLENVGGGGTQFRLVTSTRTWALRQTTLGLAFRDTTGGVEPLTLAPGAPSNSIRAETSGVALFGTGSFGGGVGVLSIANRTTAPSSNPTGGGDLYAESGALKYTGSSGPNQVIAALPSAQTCPDNGTGAAGTLTLSVENITYVALTNADPNGCTVTMSETGAYNGQRLDIVVVSAASTVTIADSAGVVELPASFVGNVWDTLTLVYAVDRFVQIGRSDN